MGDQDSPNLGEFKRVDVAGIAFASLVAAGGLMGFVKKRSVPSLAAGLTFGGLAAFGAYDATENPESPYVGLSVSGVLGAAMGARALKTRSVMPAGLVSLLSLGMFVKYGHAMYEGKMAWRRREEAGRRSVMETP